MKERPLSPKQKVFVAEYLIDLNATEACKRAGYSAKNADKIGPELLGNTRVLNAIYEAKRLREKRTAITQDLVLTDIELIKRDAMQERVDALGNCSMINHNAALKACELQGRHLSMFTDKLAMSGVVGLVDMTKEQRDAIIDAAKD